MTKEEQKIILNLLDDELEFLLRIKMEENPDLIRASAACMELLEYIPNREKILKRHTRTLIEDIRKYVDVVWNSSDPGYQEVQALFPNGKPTPLEFIIATSEQSKKTTNI